MSAIQDGKVPNADAPLETQSQEVNLHAPTLIPDDYLPDVHTRLILYKRISGAGNTEALDDLQAEIIDRFGLLPAPLKRLFGVSELKLVAAGLGITQINLGEERGRLEFGDNVSVDPIKIVNLVQREPNTFKLEGASMLRVVRQLPSFEERLAFAFELLERLAPEITEAA